MIFLECIGSRACLSAENEQVIGVKHKNLIPIFAHKKACFGGSALENP